MLYDIHHKGSEYREKSSVKITGWSDKHNLLIVYQIVGTWTINCKLLFSLNGLEYTCDKDRFSEVEGLQNLDTKLIDLGLSIKQTDEQRQRFAPFAKQIAKQRYQNKLNKQAKNLIVSLQK